MNDKLLVETAVLAGEIMLVSGAEIYRVEDTIRHILRKENQGVSEAIVLSTGIFASLNNSSSEAVTIIRRVTERSTNLNKVYMANDISRKLCEGVITIEEANEQLTSLKTFVTYKPFIKNLGYVSVSIFFTLLLGGNGRDCMGAAMVGGLLAGVLWIARKIRLNDFCVSTTGAFFIATAALCIQQWTSFDINVDKVIIGGIMSLVPGVIFTTAIRDTLNGDYSAGVARMLEAIVTALAVAAGVGTGMSVFGHLFGGGLL